MGENYSHHPLKIIVPLLKECLLNWSDPTTYFRRVLKYYKLKCTQDLDFRKIKYYPFYMVLRLFKILVLLKKLLLAFSGVLKERTLFLLGFQKNYTFMYSEK